MAVNVYLVEDTMKNITSWWHWLMIAPILMLYLIFVFYLAFAPYWSTSSLAWLYRVGGYLPLPMAVNDTSDGEERDSLLVGDM